MVKIFVQNSKFSKRDSLNEYHLEGYILFQYERKGTQGGGVFVYANKTLKSNEMIGVLWVSVMYRYGNMDIRVREMRKQKNLDRKSRVEQSIRKWFGHIERIEEKRLHK